MELSGVEPFGDGAWCDFADASDFAGGQDFFVAGHGSPKDVGLPLNEQR